MTTAPDSIAVPVNEAARLLSVHRSTIYELVKDGQITLCKIRNRSLIRRAELEAFLERSAAHRRAGRHD